MTRSCWSTTSFATIAVACSCASLHPQPVEPYSPPESVEPPPAAAQAAPPAPTAAAALSDDDRKTDECQKLGSAITANSDMLKGALDKAIDPAAGAGGLATLASSVEKAGTRVKDLELTTPRLKSWASEYQSLMSDLASALRQTEIDRAAKDKAATKKDLAGIRSVDDKEGDLVRRINAYCSP